MENEFSLKLPSAKSEDALGTELILVFKKQIIDATLSAAFRGWVPSLTTNTMYLSEATSAKRPYAMHIVY